MKLAIIGSGISGLSSAYYLSKKHKVDLFEKEDHFGGHSHTIDIKVNNTSIPLDIGFIVFNKKTYPNLINFFDENNIEIEKSNMSFSVSVRNSEIEYCGKGLSGIFSNKSNLFNINFLKMFFTIIYFYKKSENKELINEDITLGNYLNRLNLSSYFTKFHIIPMVSAIWSMPPYEAKQMPLKFFLKFFQNHGLFKLKNRPQWFTVSNRSRTYVNKILNNISGEYYKNYNINKIKRIQSGVQVYYGSKNEYFTYDKVVLATHADQALSIIEDPSEIEKKILSNFKYKMNEAIIHEDINYMPKNNKAWCSWNSSIQSENSEKNSITYWLNLLQNLDIEKNIFLTLNPYLEISEEKIIRRVNFRHPYFDQNAINSQKELHLIQNKNNILFCGSYFGYGFHEDGIKSSIDMMKYINA
tara:strand:- start:1893 stop:3131 length:1239 start_codon:yes stop_codon:yes gene_type:complete